VDPRGRKKGTKLGKEDKNLTKKQPPMYKILKRAQDKKDGGSKIDRAKAVLNNSEGGGGTSPGPMGSLGKPRGKGGRGSNRKEFRSWKPKNHPEGGKGGGKKQKEKMVSKLENPF